MSKSQSPYLVKKLVDINFQFDSINPEQQEKIKKSTDLDITLSEIVGFLEKESNNFTITNPLCIELDTLIDKTVTEWFKSIKQPRPDEEPKEIPPPPPVEIPVEEVKTEEKVVFTVEQIQDAIEALELSLELMKDDFGDKKLNKKQKKELQDLEFLIELKNIELEAAQSIIE